MEPPPAPIECTASIGSRNGRPASMRVSVISAAPSTTRHTSVVVPPMSKVSARGNAISRANCTQADTPAAGPDIAMVIGRARAAASGTIAPAEWNTCSPGPNGSCRSNSSR